jgi:transposase-like protein
MNKRKLNKRREFSEQIRRKAVKEFRSGKYTAQELADLYHCTPQTIYRWIYKYSPGDSPHVNVVEMSESADQKVNDLKQKIADLERALGQKQIKVDFYEKMLELAEEEYDLDLKKSTSSRSSSGSGSTTK